MATVTLLDSDAGSSASATVTSAATITAVVGDWLLVTFAANNREASGGSHWAPGTISDSDGINTYTTRANVNYNPAGQNTGANLVFITAAVTDALTNATISLTWNSAAVGGYALQIFRIRPGAGEAISFVAADTTGSTGNATLHSAATVSVALGNMIFGAAAIETDDPLTGDSDTSNGSWSALSTLAFANATDNLAMSHAIQWKTVTGSGNQSWACSTTSAKDSARSYLVLHLASAAYSLVASGSAYNYNGTAATMRVGVTPLVAGVGSYAMTGTTPVTLLHGAVIAALAGSYTLSGTDAATTHQWKATADIGSYALTGTDATPFKTAVGGKTIAAELGTYALAGTTANLLHAYLPSAVAGSYALTGTVTPTLHGWRIAAGIDTGLPLLDELGNPLLDELDNPILNEGGVVGGVYSLTGSIVGLNRSAGNKIMIAEAGTYTLTGTDATPTSVTLVNKTLAADVGSYALTGSTANTLVGFKVAALAGSYTLLGTDAALSKSTAKSIAAEAGSYALTGTDTTLTLGVAPAVPLEPSPLHIGEWPRDKKNRRRREDAAAAEQRARKRFRDAIGRLLEGLPPEFDEPLDEALDSAVEAANLLYAMSAPIREINAVNELIDHIRQLRIAQPIAQLHLAQAYNQAHRHLAAKASEDTVMALLLGE